MKILEYYRKKASIIDRIKNEYIYEAYELPDSVKEELREELVELDKEYNIESTKNDHDTIIESIDNYLNNVEEDSYS